MNIIVDTAPAELPVTLAQAYEQLKLTPDDDSPPTHPEDALIERCISGATDATERATHRAFVTQTLVMTVAGFPHNCDGYIELLRPPVASVESVEYYDEDNVLQTVTASHYFVTDDFVPRLMFTDEFPFPCPYRRSDAVRITYVAGYGDAGDVPETIKTVILMLMTDLYENRDGQIIGTITSINETLNRMLVPYQVPRA